MTFCLMHWIIDIRTHNDLVRKRKLNHLIKLAQIAPVLSKEFLHIQATIACRFTLKRVRDMLITSGHWIIIFSQDSHYTTFWWKIPSP